MGLRCIILDIDGTLVLSNNAHAHAWEEALAEHGYKIPYDDIRPLIGMGGDNLLPELNPKLTQDDLMAKAISKRRSQLFLRKYAPNLKPTRGARDLVLELHDRGIKRVIATSANEEELDALLSAAHLSDLIDHSASKNDATQSKPAPDIVVAALHKSGCSASDCVMLGDTSYDAKSSRDAGVPFIALRCGGARDSDLAGADEIYDDPADLLAHLKTSRFFR